MPSQLTCRDLQAGDVLLKVSDGSVLNQLIQAGQSITGGLNAQITHAGLMFDKTYVIESAGHGITAGDLRVQNKPYGYYAYRCGNPNLSAGAGTCAKMMFDIHKAHDSMKYTVLGAAKSLFGSGSPTTPADMDALLDRVLSGKNTPFFCSMFVVYVYQFVAAQSGMPASSLFNDAAGKTPPTKLASMLSTHAKFSELGWLLPGQR